MLARISQAIPAVCDPELELKRTRSLATQHISPPQQRERGRLHQRQSLEGNILASGAIASKYSTNTGHVVPGLKVHKGILTKRYISQNMPHIADCQNFTLLPIVIYQAKIYISKKDDTVLEIGQIS